MAGSSRRELGKLMIVESARAQQYSFSDTLSRR